MENESLHSQPSVVVRFFRTLSTKYQSLLDAWTPYTLARWLLSLFLLLAYMARVIISQGWYIVTYALGIYYLNLLVAFLTPKFNPALIEEDSEDGPSLPTTRDQEFRPFIRRLPEFKFWHSATKATLIAMLCTFFEAFNVPVFWPILLLYFITLFCLTMKNQIKHMIKYHYLPWTHGKTRYKGKDDSGKVVYSNIESAIEM